MQLICPACEARYVLAPTQWPTSQDEAGHLVLPARKVRCKRCSHVWLATPPVLAEKTPARPITARQRRQLRAKKGAAAYQAQSAALPALAARQAVADLPEPAANDLDEDPDTEAPRRTAASRFAGIATLLVAALTGVFAYDHHSNHFGFAAKAQPFIAQAAGNLPAIDLPHLAVPQIRVPEVQLQLPRTAPPPLSIEADAIKRSLNSDQKIWEISGTIINPTQTDLRVPLVEVQLLDAAHQIVHRWTVKPNVDSLPPAGQARIETSAFDPPANAVQLRMELKLPEIGRL